MLCLPVNLPRGSNELFLHRLNLKYLLQSLRRETSHSRVFSANGAVILSNYQRVTPQTIPNKHMSPNISGIFSSMFIICIFNDYLLKRAVTDNHFFSFFKPYTLNYIRYVTKPNTRFLNTSLFIDRYFLDYIHIR